ncbi:hypothetical protein VTJ49DRAFT_5520 [Mycothermus thermophilus]|uniref:Uncharacterized protein n=1 Tax=Humicola insolens TaxID=85995 RepID=A0ABR3VKI3_HUMIN
MQLTKALVLVSTLAVGILAAPAPAPAAEDGPPGAAPASVSESAGLGLAPSADERYPTPDICWFECREFFCWIPFVGCLPECVYACMTDRCPYFKYVVPFISSLFSYFVATRYGPTSPA